MTVNEIARKAAEDILSRPRLPRLQGQELRDEVISVTEIVQAAITEDRQQQTEETTKAERRASKAETMLFSLVRSVKTARDKGWDFDSIRDILEECEDSDVCKRGRIVMDDLRDQDAKIAAAERLAEAVRVWRYERFHGRDDAEAKYNEMTEALEAFEKARQS